MGHIGNTVQTAFTSFDKQIITGSGTAVYTLSHSVANEQEIEVFVNNVRQEPSVAYNVSGNTLTMTGNVASTDDFYVVFQGKAVQTVTHPSDQPLESTTGTFSGAVSVGTIKDSSGTTTAMTIDASGLVNMPVTTSAQEFRLTADKIGSGTSPTVLTGWEENDTDYQAINSYWSESSGVFSCSQTGIYTASWTLVVKGASGNDAFDPAIQISTDSGSNYNTRAQCWEYVGTSDYGATIGNTFMFKVSDTSTFRLRYMESITNNIFTGTTIKGSSTVSLTNIVFVRLGNV